MFLNVFMTRGQSRLKKSMKFKLLSVYLFVYCCGKVGAVLPGDDGIRPQVTFLDPGTIMDSQPKSRHIGFFDKDMRIYCYRGVPKDLTRFFENVELQLEIDSDEYTQYEGATPAEVRQHFDERRSLFSFDFFINKRTRLQLFPFKQQCIGIDTVLPYRVRLLQFRVDYFRIIQFALGLCVFKFAGRLSHNSLFYYFTGVAFGICSSFMLLIWLSSKLMPRRPLVYGMLLGGWAVGVYIIQRLWENLHLIFEMYRAYVLWYILITGLLSFFFCYRIGPPKNQRSKNIIKWILQIMAIALIYLSSQYEEASAAIGVVAVVMNYFPFYIFHHLLKIYRRFFPPKRRLLTSEEFYDQGVLETSKALNELREYASSPDCKQWTIISKLRDPLRFAAFVEGDNHIQEEEISDFENVRQENEVDDSDISTSEEEKVLKKDQSRNLSYYRYRNEPMENLKGRKNIAHEELSEEDTDSDEYINHRETDNTKKAETVYSNNIRNELSSTRSSVRHAYSDEKHKAHLTDTSNSITGRGQQNQNPRQQALLSSKVDFSQNQRTPGNIRREQQLYKSGNSNEYTYRVPYEPGGSESDDY